MALPNRDLAEFLRLNNLDTEPYLSTEDDHDAGSSPFDTLWTEFARSHPRLSPPRSPTLTDPLPHPTIHTNYRSYAEQSSSPRPDSHATLDLRALEYVIDYDINLMCPICHIPFIDPIVLDCDHTFCHECYDTYRNGGSGSDRSRCPACRAYHLGGSRRANRLIRNMASEVHVKCPNSGCEVVTPRSSIQQHTSKECPEELLTCPITTCHRQTKRRNFVDNVCIHETHIDCECGANIRLGRGEWIRHKDEQCPLTVRTTSRALSRKGSVRRNQEACPGTPYGCDFTSADSVSQPDPNLTAHISTCTMAKLIPFFQKQENLVKTLQGSLDKQTQRNDLLESGLDRLNDMITNAIQPKLEQIANTTSRDSVINLDNDAASEIEEIPRSPTDLQFHHIQQHHDLSNISTHINHLANLDHRLTSLEAQHHSDISDLHRSLRDMDARTSLSIMNETLRIREELAHLNGGMYSTRAQVTYLLNHHRITSQQQALNGMARRYSSGMNGGVQPAGSTSSTGAGTATAPTSSNSQPGTSSTTGMSTSPSSSANINIPTTQTNIGMNVGSSSGSTSTSPIFTATRPNLRRGSGSAGGSRSSVDRVKL